MRWNYITIWDHWSGTSPAEDAEDTPEWRTVNLAQAVERGLLADAAATDLLEDFRERLEREGVEVFRLVPEHLLVSLDAADELRRDEQGAPHVCLCNFQYLRCPPTEVN